VVAAGPPHQPGEEREDGIELHGHQEEVQVEPAQRQVGPEQVERGGRRPGLPVLRLEPVDERPGQVRDEHERVPAPPEPDPALPAGVPRRVDQQEPGDEEEQPAVGVQQHQRRGGTDAGHRLREHDRVRGDDADHRHDPHDVDLREVPAGGALATSRRRAVRQRARRVEGHEFIRGWCLPTIDRESGEKTSRASWLPGHPSGCGAANRQAGDSLHWPPVRGSLSTHVPAPPGRIPFLEVALMGVDRTVPVLQPAAFRRPRSR